MDTCEIAINYTWIWNSSLLYPNQENDVVHIIIDTADGKQTGIAVYATSLCEKSCFFRNALAETSADCPNPKRIVMTGVSMRQIQLFLNWAYWGVVPEHRPKQQAQEPLNACAVKQMREAVRTCECRKDGKAECQTCIAARAWDREEMEGVDDVTLLYAFATRIAAQKCKDLLLKELPDCAEGFGKERPAPSAVSVEFARRALEKDDPLHRLYTQVLCENIARGLKSMKL